MGLTSKSTGINAVDAEMSIEKKDGQYVVALAGNPNVGKSTVFNALTGLNQHTGNWAGKTVTNAQGRCEHNGVPYIMVDIPGTYSLMSHSVEEEVARDFICFGKPDAVIVVCDATCLERNLNLVLQTIEITSKTIVCVNLLDEAEKKHIKVDLDMLEKSLGVPVVGVVARSEKGLDLLLDRLETVVKSETIHIEPVKYNISIDEEIKRVSNVLAPLVENKIPIGWTALKLLTANEQLNNTINNFLGFQLTEDEAVKEILAESNKKLEENGINNQQLNDTVITEIISTAEKIAENCVTYEKDDFYERDRKIDSVLTSRRFGIPIMIILLGLIFWITIVGANYPSQLLSNSLFWLGDRMREGLVNINAPIWLTSVLIDGMYKVLAWVVAVMLPPMAIFFPLFTLLEDLGYLPRVAFNLDKHFRKANACGKQCLTMCMGFGCNAAGVVGCRIIDSPRERLIAIITNNFVPCNGRFPTLISIIMMFFVSSAILPLRSFYSMLILLSVILLGVFMTFMISRLLSVTILKGLPSSFTLELPPYRKPQIGKVIVHSIFDRTLFVLGRACAVAIPAGLIIWIFANIMVGDKSVLMYCADFLDPFAKFIGLDGVILLAFILGFPANEIVLPIIIMAYMATGSIMELDDLNQLKTLLVDNNWTWITAICTMLFSLMHFPCSTTCLTIKKETKSIKWTLVSMAVPTVCGIIICAVVANVGRLFL